MKVLLTRKLSERINGVDLSGATEGDTLELSTRDALTLLAEGWAAPVEEVDGVDRALDRANDRPPHASRRRGRARRIKR